MGRWLLVRSGGNQQPLPRVCQNSEIPPTEVGGKFRSSLCTVPTDFLNPTNGSWWMVQIRPSKQGGPSAYKRDLSFMRLLREQVGSEQSTNSRWWIPKFPKPISLWVGPESSTNFR